MSITVAEARGFTLIELLIAMSLTVLIGAISYQFLDASIRVQSQGDAALKSLTAIEQTWQLIAADMQNSIDRPVGKPAVGADLLSVLDTGSTGQGRRPSMMSAQFNNVWLSALLNREGALLWFPRHGWVNPLEQQRSGIQRVVYRLDNNGSLFRDYWSERNQLFSSAPEGSLMLLENVQAISITFLPQGQHPDTEWLPSWPPSLVQVDETEVHGLPAALKVSLQTAELGRVERIFLLAGV
ncbi:MAG: type II secretion system protein GspJ [Pseudohongiella sp.]|nr:type II secretion system protein GspJ [Pseudohongiella sp.]